MRRMGESPAVAMGVARIRRLTGKRKGLFYLARVKRAASGWICCRLFEKSQSLRGRQRAAEQEALELVAAMRAQQIELGVCLDAFGDDVDAEAVRQRDRRNGDCRVVGVAPDIGDEGAVDLQVVDR